MKKEQKLKIYYTFSIIFSGIQYKINYNNKKKYQSTKK